MTRAPFQVIVIPFRRTGGSRKFAIFRRSDSGYWQTIAGGGEDDETTIDAARREALEEAGIESGVFYQLKCLDMVPVVNFMAHTQWPEDLYVIPQHTFAVEVTSRELKLSAEHTAYQWLSYAEAAATLYWQSNKSAVWELNERLKNNDLPTSS
ncbi:MAG: NUDIX pyrophosphatase [Actinomycetota bacterium]